MASLAAGRYTTIVTLFQNEPSQEQVREIERLHHDFEVANEVHLSTPSVDSSRLAYPFPRLHSAEVFATQ